MRKNKKINATFRHGGMKVNSSHSGVKVSNKRQRVYSKNKKNLYNRKNNIKNQNQSYYSQSRKKRFMTSTSNMIVNYTPDFYDKAHGDVSIHASKVVIGNSFMVARNFKRIGVSLMDRVNKIRARGNYSYGNIEKARKIESNIGKHRGFSIRTSVRQTVSNQTRKLTHKATNQNDFSSKTLGKGMRMTWATVKYRKKFVTAVKSVAFFIRSTISSIIALVTSIPAMLVSIIASIPALIVVLIISIIITFFSSYQYYGRIDGLMEHINQLNAKYQVNIDVIDLLSITYALDWTQGSYEMYDTLCSYIYTTKGEQVDFEDALTKVFKNNNPSLNINNNFQYGFDDTKYIEGSYLYKTQKKENEKKYFDIYPDYKALAVGNDRKGYGSLKNINALKEKARNSQEYNMTIYDEYEWKNNGIINYEEINDKVLSYTSIIKKHAQKYDMNDYVSLIQAVMMQESGGQGNDPMQSSEGAFNKKYPHTPNAITDPEYSIECGIQELRSCLNKAKVKSPSDIQKIYLALQGYNFGNKYIDWALEKDGGYTQTNAQQFSDIQKKKLSVSVYGDVNYVPHVMRYYTEDLSGISVTAQKILMTAKSKLGCPYYWGKTGPDMFDCSGFVYYCLKNAGVSEGRLTADGYAHRFKEIPYSQLKAGDLITFSHDGGKTAGHIGIYVGKNKFIHASGEGSTCLGNHASRGHVVKYSELNGYYKNRIYKCRRIE